MKAFQSFEAGKVYVTGDGRRLRCLAVDRPDDHPIVLMDIETGAITVTSRRGGLPIDPGRVIGEEVA